MTDTERLDFIEKCGGIWASISWEGREKGLLWREDELSDEDVCGQVPGFKTFRELIDCWIEESRHGQTVRGGGENPAGEET